MAITTFAAIYIGSYEVSLKIFELSGKKRSVRSTISAQGWSLAGIRSTPVRSALTW